MKNLASHMRISGIQITDSDVESRKEAIKTLAIMWGKEKKSSSIVSTAAMISDSLSGDGTPSVDLGEQVQNEIQKKSPSFLYEERALDVGICSAMAMVSLLDGPHNTNSVWINKDIYATAFWLILSFQPILEDDRREKLRRELLELAAKWSINLAESARVRLEVPDPSCLNITMGEDNTIANNFKEAISNSINTLRYNAALDREELDFLWWAQSGSSRVLKRRLSEVEEPVRIISAGIEGAKLLRHLPCEVNREIILRTLSDNPILDLNELLLAIESDRSELNKAFLIENVNAHPTVFPLLHALSTGASINAGASIKRPLSEWGERALLEATFATMMSHGVGKL
ncbi:hypothetical protein M5X66_11695 [Providencia sp. PROV188]|uniref:GTPase-associated system all-helical protein GASH n=1 Tax=Providencia sp. PROV188 TaxID=2939731 RepID=UPI0022DDD1B2|nr:hypothetical protein M5X66_11695 [Providencia sp. PROV188]